MNKNNIIYFDNAASAKPLDEALEAFNMVAKDFYCNPAALHKGGIEAEKLIQSAKGWTASCLPKGGTVCFTSGATESNNLAIQNAVKSRGKKKIVTTSVEHPSVSGAVSRFQFDFEVVRVPPHADILTEVDDSTALVSMTAVCSETGRIIANPASYSIIKSRFPQCVVHVDAAQGFMKVPVNADLISVSAHKIGGLPGIGALFVKDGIKVNPMLFGGDQQKGLRPGTETTALASAFAAAICVNTNSPFDFAGLHERLIDGLKRLSLRINSKNNVPNIVNFSCGVKSEVMLHFMAEHSIYVSSGSACARGKKSRILPAYIIPDEDVDTAVRVSFGRQNTAEEVDTFLEVLETGLKRWK